ncbi:MAG: hypothetical protein WAM53_03780 [Terrimicrobiaceae bacterium]
MQLEFSLEDVAKSLEHLFAVAEISPIRLKRLRAGNRELPNIDGLALALEPLRFDLKARVDVGF